MRSAPRLNSRMRCAASTDTTASSATASTPAIHSRVCCSSAWARLVGPASKKVTAMAGASPQVTGAHVTLRGRVWPSRCSPCTL